MPFQTIHCIQLLERTPPALQALLIPLDETWIHRNEGDETWSPKDVILHLIHCECTNWLPRVQLILSDTEDRNFTLLNRSAHPDVHFGSTLPELLQSFAELRSENIRQLRALTLTDTDLERTALHPEFGTVTLSQLLSTWAVHDLNHLSQIARVMAHQYKDSVGPWKAYLRIVREH